MKGVDPNQCPQCGHTGTLREIAKRVTWQPIRLAWAVNGDRDLYVEAYEVFDYGDDPLVDNYDCVDCGAEWDTIDQLRSAMLAAPFADDVGANLLYNTLVERGFDAEDVIARIAENGGDLWFGFFGPAVDAAAAEIGLPPLPEETHGTDTH